MSLFSLLIASMSLLCPEVMAGVLTRSGAASVLLSSASRAFSSSPPSTRPFPLPSISLLSIDARKKRLFLGSFCSSSSSSSQVAPAAETRRTDADGDAPSPSPSPSASSDPIKEAADALDIRVGRILRAWRHPEADSLYVEEVDLGEPEPRTICSGLVNYIPLDDLQWELGCGEGSKSALLALEERVRSIGGWVSSLMGSCGIGGKILLSCSDSGDGIADSVAKDTKVVVLANLKPRNMRGIKSNGMLMAASDASHENVELLLPPEGSIPGERIWFGLEEEKENQLDAATPNQVQKKKIWESVQPHLKTSDSCAATLGIRPMRTSAGVVVCKSLKNANIS